MIKLLAYNPNWKLLFGKEKTNLLALDIKLIIKIEHIGSTAIPGIHAKPVIDILIGVTNLNLFGKNEIQKIESLGYQYNASFEKVLPYRRYFQKNNQQGERIYQIHLVSFPSQWFDKHILFCAYLNQNTAIAKAYEILKQSLAKKFDNTIDYANAKSHFCRRIDKKAFADFSINKPLIQTKRLLGLIPQLACHADYAKMLSDTQFIQCYGIFYNKAQALKRLKSDMNHWNQYAFAPWMWYDKKTHAYIGRGGLKTFSYHDHTTIELTYQIRREFWKNGFATEIGKASIEYAFNILNLKQIIGFSTSSNFQLQQVMQKLGFVYEHNFLYKNIPHQLYKIENPMK